jgi:NADPH:quinone reductase-like Zn-dependent oxidoreductase
MKAIVLPAYGDADKLELRDIPEPKPGPNEIAVRVTAASLNPVDWKLRSGALQKYMPLELPAVLGRDVAGTVVAVGPGVTAFTVGARVLGLVQRGYAEIVVASLDAWAPVPAKLDLTEAAALPLVVLTGAQLAEEAVGVREGEVLLVTGAAGGVGRATVFAAKARGARVYAGVRGAQKAEAAKLGADGVVALDDLAEVNALPPLDAIADTVGGDAVKAVLGKVKAGGRIGSVVGEPPGAKERGLAVRPMWTHPDPRRLAELAQAVADGKLVIPIAKRLPLSEARQAHKLAEKGAGGKVLLTIPG